MSIRLICSDIDGTLLQYGMGKTDARKTSKDFGRMHKL